MFLLGVEFVFASYISVRLYEKFNSHRDTELKQLLLSNQLTSPIESAARLKRIRYYNKLAEPKINKFLKYTPLLSIEKKQKNQKLQTIIDDSERGKYLHHLKISLVSIISAGLTYWNPVFLIPTMLTFTYVAIPYLRVMEHSLLVKKKIDGYVLYGIADFMTLGLGDIMTAAFAVSLLHTSHFIMSNAEKNSKDSIINIFAKQPRTAWLWKNGTELETPLEKLRPNDVIVVNSGDLIPVDGIVIAGMATVDQHLLTGEFQPIETWEGSKVFASTQVMSGRIYIRLSASGDDTAVAKITTILNNSIDFKTNTQLKGEQWADSWNLPVLGLAFASMPILGPTGTIVILNGHIAQTIRVVAPLSTLNYLTIAAIKGILVKDGRVLENLPNIDTFLFDKTGTLTSNEPEVGRILLYDAEYSENEILTYAAAAERKLQHPIARAILKLATARALPIPHVEDADYQIGYGINVHIDGKLIQVGSHRFMDKEGIILPNNLPGLELIHNSGHSIIMLAINKKLIGLLEMHAVVRPEAQDIITNLRKNGAKHLILVSGDHQQPTQKLAESLGMDGYFYDVLPDNKAEIVEKLQAQGQSVCFIGDGVNDTIAMKKANISISLSGASSVATDTAQIVLMDGSLSKLLELIKLSHELKRNLQDSWWLNMVPGITTVIAAFTLNINIVTGLLLSQTGLGLGVVNAVLPLQQAKIEEKRKIQQLIT